MMFYFLSKGRTQGPISEIELKEMIESKKIGPFDLVYPEGGEKWSTLKGYPQFTSVLQGAWKSATSEPVWVILRQIKTEAGMKNQQDGPFTQAEVKRKLMQGEVSYDDFVWTDGMADWYRLGHLEDFSLFEPPAVDLDRGTDPSIRLGQRPPVPGSEAKAIRVLRLKKVKVLTAPAPSLEPKREVTASGVIRPGVPRRARAKPAVKRSSFGLAEGLLASLVIVGVGAIIWLLSPGKVVPPAPITNVPILSPVKTVESPTQENDDVAEPSESLPPQTTLPPGQRPASYAKMFLVGSPPAQRLRFATDGALPGKVALGFVSEPGNTLGKSGFEKVLKLDVNANLESAIPTNALVPGQYTVELRDPPLRSQKSILFGVKSFDRFKKQLNSYRKQIVGRHIYEKLALYAVMGDLMSLKQSNQSLPKLQKTISANLSRDRLHVLVWRRIADVAARAGKSEAPSAELRSEIDDVAGEVRRLTIFRRL